MLTLDSVDSLSLSIDDALTGSLKTFHRQRLDDLLELNLHETSSVSSLKNVCSNN